MQYLFGLGVRFLFSDDRTYGYMMVTVTGSHTEVYRPRKKSQAWKIEDFAVAFSFSPPLTTAGRIYIVVATSRVPYLFGVKRGAGRWPRKQAQAQND